MTILRNRLLSVFLMASIASTLLYQQGVAQDTPPQAAPAPKATLSAEAIVAVRRGEEYLRGKEYKKAIEMVKLAAKLHPQYGRLRHMLGQAYIQDKQLGQAWLHFRQAVRLDRSFAPAIRDFESLWQAFDTRHVFTCGRSSQEVLKLLGKPDSVTPNGKVEIWEYGYKRLHFLNGRLGAVVDPRGLGDTLATETHKLEFEFDDQSRWTLANRLINRFQAITEHIPAGESIASWSEMYAIQRLFNVAKKGQSPTEMAKNFEANLKKANPNVEFVILKEDEGDVLFHWRDVGDESKKRKPQHEIVRLVTDGRDIHRIAYTQRVAQIPADAAKQWASVLQKAKLVAKPIAAPTE